MSDEEYDYVGKATIWMCVNNGKCKVTAISAIATDVEIEQMQHVFRKKNKLGGASRKSNGKLETKADKVMVDKLAVEAILL